MTENDGLFHFTSTHHWPLIVAAGILTTTESNVGSPRADWPPSGPDVAPRVVWLTDAPHLPARRHGLTLSPKVMRELGVSGMVDKSAVRIEVAVDDAIWWPDFADEHGMNPRWRRAIEEGHAPETWWVVPREILMSEFVDVQFT